MEFLSFLKVMKYFLLLFFAHTNFRQTNTHYIKIVSVRTCFQTIFAGDFIMNDFIKSQIRINE